MLFAMHVGDYLLLLPVLIVVNHRAMHLVIKIGSLPTLRTVLVVLNLPTMLVCRPLQEVSDFFNSSPQ